MKNAGKACNNRLYRHIRTFEKIVKNYFVIYLKIYRNFDKNKNQQFVRAITTHCEFLHKTGIMNHLVWLFQYFHAIEFSELLG